MTEAVFDQDAYLKNFHATITAVDGERIKLDRTIFYHWIRC
jgi:Ser-tRNA(Ala) deacylase AlaX